jgi:hypothetical protein
MDKIKSYIEEKWKWKYKNSKLGYHKVKYKEIIPQNY